MAENKKEARKPKPPGDERLDLRKEERVRRGRFSAPAPVTWKARCKDHFEARFAFRIDFLVGCATMQAKREVLMRITPVVAIKQFRDLIPGEIFTFWLNSSIVRGIFVGPNEGGQTPLCMVLDDAGHNPVFWVTGKRGLKNVASFGTDWILEFDTGASIRPPGDERLSGIVGAIVLSDRGPLVNVITMDEYRDKELGRLSLENWTFDNPDSRSGFVSRWSIWIDEDHRSRPGAEPWFRFETQAADDMTGSDV
jgi:hypothetical protein